VPSGGLRIGDGPNMRRIQQTLAERGIMVAHAAAYSGVGPGGALRLAVCSLHTQTMIDRLLDTLAGVL